MSKHTKPYPSVNRTSKSVQPSTNGIKSRFQRHSNQDDNELRTIFVLQPNVAWKGKQVIGNEIKEKDHTSCLDIDIEKQNVSEIYENDHEVCDYDKRRKHCEGITRYIEETTKDAKRCSREMSAPYSKTEVDNNNTFTNISDPINDNNKDKEEEEHEPNIDVHNTFPRFYRALSPPYLSTATASIRSESLRSQLASDCELSSSTSDINKKVSFNNDVKIKRIPAPKSRLASAGDIFKRASSPEKNILSHQKLKEPGVVKEVEVRKEQPPENKEDIAHETNLILSQLEGLECRSSNSSSKPQLAPKPDLVQQRNNSIASLRAKLSNSISNLSSLSSSIKSNNDKKVNNTINNKSFEASSETPTTTYSTKVNTKIISESSNPEKSEELVLSDDPGMRLENSDLDTTTTSGIHSGGSTEEATNPNSSLSSNNTIHNSNDNRLYGLHALNNLDIAVNGKEVNSMPSYQEVRRRTSIGSTNSGSGGGGIPNPNRNTETNSGEYSPPARSSTTAFQATTAAAAPPKPPRKAPSTSPPSLRRGSLSNNNSNSVTKTEGTMEMSQSPITHYAQPAISGALSDTNNSEHYNNQPHQRNSIVNSMMEQLNQDAGFKRRLMQQPNALNTPEDSAIASGDGGTATDIERDNAPSISGSYTSRYIRKSPPRHLVSPTHQIQSRMSPSRSCLTDTEILRSPTEVLYAVSDKQKYPTNDRISQQQSSSQIIHPENNRNKNSSNQHRSRRVASREELLYADPDAYHNGHNNNNVVSGSRSNLSHRQQQPSAYQRSISDHSMKYLNSEMNRRQQNLVQGSRSLERFLEDDPHEADKENTFKTRITVISPERSSNNVSHTIMSRKPYKTMINTATDNIQYKGTQHGAHYATAPKHHRQQQQQTHSTSQRMMMDNEHYKVQVD